MPYTVWIRKEEDGPLERRDTYEDEEIAIEMADEHIEQGSAVAIVRDSYYTDPIEMPGTVIYKTGR